MKNIFFVLAFFLCLPLFISAQWSTDPDENNPINVMSGEQAIPKIATCDNGDSYIAFFSNESGNYNVRMQRLDSQGNELWETGGILISDHTQMSWLTDWDMTADNSNHAILTFQDIRNEGNNNVVAYRIAPDGDFVWGDDGLALSNSIAFDASPKVTSTSTGNAVFAWQADEVIILQKISPAGAYLWGENGITLTSPNTFSWPQLLPVGTDDVILKYFHDSGPTWAPTRHVYAQRFDGDGDEVWDSPAAISTAGGISAWTQIFPFMNDGSDGFYIAWHDDRDNNLLSSTFVQHVSSTGDILYSTNGVEASTMGGRNNFYPELALPTGSSDVFVFWNEMDGDQNLRGIYGQKISSAGDRLWTNNGKSFIEISSTNVLPLAARDTPTDMILVYEDYLNSLDGHIKAMRIDIDGDFVWTPDFTDICTVNSEKVHTVVNHFGNNQLIVSWEDGRNSSRDIYAQNIQLSGDLGPWVDPNGTIMGSVELSGGNGNLSDVAITAGDVTVSPDFLGHYVMIIENGSYDVTASLSGYMDDVVSDVIVIAGETTSGIDFSLDPISGFIEGTVVLNGGSGNVMNVQVSAGGVNTNPDEAGYYMLEVPSGIVDVTASLTGYDSETIYGVVVPENNTMPGIDFELEPTQILGSLEGMVELENNAGDVTQVEVTAGFTTVLPDASGYYFMELVAGIWDVSASLEGFLTSTNMGVEVLVGQTTQDVDFFLFQDIQTGFMEGTVSAFNGTVDITEVTVYAGTQVAYPDVNGNYVLELPPGNYTVYASHPYTLTDSAAGVQVENEITVFGVDFDLEVVYADMICIAYMYGSNDIMHDVVVEISGPDSTFSGYIDYEHDSIIFYRLRYGLYSGEAWWNSTYAGYTDIVLGEDNHYMEFWIVIEGIKDGVDQSAFGLKAVPNPFWDLTKVCFNLEEKTHISIRLFDLQGHLISTLQDGEMIAGEHQVELSANQSATDLKPGIYYVVVEGMGKMGCIRVIKL